MTSNAVTGILAALPAHVERAARFPAAHPGPHLTVGLAAGIPGTCPDDARRLLHELVDAELVTDLGGGRWTHHQLTAAALDNALDPGLRGVVMDTIGQHYRTRAAVARAGCWRACAVSWTRRRVRRPGRVSSGGGPSGGPGTRTIRSGRWSNASWRVVWRRRRGGEPTSSGCGACGSGCVDRTGDRGQSSRTCSVSTDSKKGSTWRRRSWIT